MTPDAMREDAYACIQRIRSVHRSNRSSVPRTTPEKVVPKRTIRQHGGECLAEERKNVTKVDGDRHPTLVRSPTVLVSGRRRERVRQRRREGRGRRCMPLDRCADRTGLVQRRRYPHVGILTRRKVERWSHLHAHAHGQHALVDAPRRWRRRDMAPLGARCAVKRGVVGLKARWRWGWAAGRQQGRFLINLRCWLWKRLLLNGACGERLRPVGILVVLANRLAAASHGGRERM